MRARAAGSCRRSTQSGATRLPPSESQASTPRSKPQAEALQGGIALPLVPRGAARDSSARPRLCCGSGYSATRDAAPTSAHLVGCTENWKLARRQRDGDKDGWRTTALKGTGK